ncbi:MAG: transketolase C-terminal domain-containing protein [Candidatus Gracilibacteria bacterium]
MFSDRNGSIGFPEARTALQADSLLLPVSTSQAAPGTHLINVGNGTHDGSVFSGFLKYDLKNPQHPNNDRLIFSKGHASPLFYALYAAAGDVSEEELKTLRKFGSRLEGHPTPVSITEAATARSGRAFCWRWHGRNAKYLDKLPKKTTCFWVTVRWRKVRQWEAMQIASHYQPDNLIGIIDVNALGQRGETMYGHETKVYEERVKAFDEIIVIDGHNLRDVVYDAYEKAQNVKGKPVMIIARTFGACGKKGVSFLEGKDNWHGKALGAEDLQKALAELGEINTGMKGEIALPENLTPAKYSGEKMGFTAYDKTKPVATRRAYGNAITRLFADYPNMVVLDAEVGNSTFAEIFKKKYPEHFFEMFSLPNRTWPAWRLIFTQEKNPLHFNLAAFSRAFDQIRMSQYSTSNIKFVGSQQRSFIGEDGSSRWTKISPCSATLLNAVVLYPSGTPLPRKNLLKRQPNMLATSTSEPPKTLPTIYDEHETFPIGDCKVVKKVKLMWGPLSVPGVTLFEALTAHEELAKENIAIRVVDLYSVKPIHVDKLLAAIAGTKAVITVEDHFVEGGLGEAVKNGIGGRRAPFRSIPWPFAKCLTAENRKSFLNTKKFPAKPS